MTNFASAIKSEIVRLSSKAARQLLAPVQRATATHRRQIAALRRQVDSLEKELKTQRTASSADTAKQPAPRTVRFVAKGLASQRKQLGLSAGDFGQLLGVSAQSVYNWEAKKTTPRNEQVLAIAALRGIGKRQARARLAIVSTKGSK